MYRFLSALFSYSRVIFPRIFLSFSTPALVVDTSSPYSKYSEPVRLSFPLTIREFLTKVFHAYYRLLKQSEFQTHKSVYQAIVEGSNPLEPLYSRAALLRLI